MWRVVEVIFFVTDVGAVRLGEDYSDGCCAGSELVYC